MGRGRGRGGGDERGTDGPVTMATLPLRRFVGGDEVVAILVGGFPGSGEVVPILGQCFGLVRRDSTGTGNVKL